MFILNIYFYFGNKHGPQVKGMAWIIKMPVMVRCFIQVPTTFDSLVIKVINTKQ